MRELLLVRYGEIFLKGLNRPVFMRALVKRVKHAVAPLHGEVWLHDGRIFVSGFDDMEACVRRVTKVFGVHSVCPAVEMDKGDFDAICAQAVRMTEGLTGTFKVVARRSDKQYPLDSPAIGMEMGYRILQAHPELSVDVHNPQHVVNVEIRDKCYLYVKVIMAVGGMPVGTGGRATLLLSGGIDSPVAGWMIAKRGVRINAVHFHSYPYTSDRAKEKVLDLARILSESCCGIRVHVVPFTHIQMEIHEKCPEEYTTLIMRRFMMRIAERVALKEQCEALITGESIGQVASQTVQSLAATNEVCTMPVFRPVIGFDKQEIVDISLKINTYETSIQPYEDCCTIFVAKHPVTKPNIQMIKKSEKKLEEKIDEMMDQAVNTAERIYIEA